MSKAKASKATVKEAKAREPFVMLPLSLVDSAAWRTASINALRLVYFLIREHLRHGGQENGKLVATHRQLHEFGLNARFVANAIAEAEALGLVDVHRHGMRVASTYGLTWIVLHDKTMPDERWRRYQPRETRPQRSKTKLNGLQKGIHEINTRPSSVT